MAARALVRAWKRWQKLQGKELPLKEWARLQVDCNMAHGKECRAWLERKRGAP